MVGEKLYLDFLGQLSLHSSLLHLFLAYHLDCKHKPCPEIPSHIDISEATFAQFTSNLKLFQRKFFTLSRDEHAAEIHKWGLSEVAIIATRVPFLHKQFFVDVVSAFFEEVGLVFLFLGFLDPSFIGVDHAGLVDRLAQSLGLDVFDRYGSLFIWGGRLRLRFAHNSLLGWVYIVMRWQLSQHLQTFVWVAALGIWLFVRFWVGVYSALFDRISILIGTRVDWPFQLCGKTRRRWLFQPWCFGRVGGRAVGCCSQGLKLHRVNEL